MNKIEDWMTRVRRVDPMPRNPFKGFADSPQAQEILKAILEVPPREAEEGGVVRMRKPRRGWHVRAIVRRTIAIGVAAAVAFGITALGGSRLPNQGGNTVWAAELVRFAEASPRLLITKEGWTVTRADERNQNEGEMRFVSGNESMELHWRPVDTHSDYFHDRKQGSAQSWDISIDGRPGVLFQYADTSPGILTFTAMWLGEQHSLELRGDSFDAVDEYRAVAATVKAVDVDSWLSAMPESVIKPASRTVVVDEMLKDIPIPDSIDVGELKTGVIVSDRYQLGAQVTGVVACAWIDQWIGAVAEGNASRRDEAVSALRSSRDWDILQWMLEEGQWSNVLWSYADAIVAGPNAGPEVVADYRSGIGCDSN